MPIELESFLKKDDKIELNDFVGSSGIELSDFIQPQEPENAPVAPINELSDSLPASQAGGVILPPVEETQKPINRNRVDQIVNEITFSQAPPKTAFDSSRDFFGDLLTATGKFAENSARGTIPKAIGGVASASGTWTPEQVARERGRGILAFDPEHDPEYTGAQEVTLDDRIEAQDRNDRSDLKQVGDSIVQNRDAWLRENAENLPEAEFDFTVEAMTDPNVIGQMIGGTLPQILAGIGIGWVTKNPMLGAGIVGAQTALVEGGTFYNDAIEAGMTVSEAKKSAAVVGIVNGLLDSTPIFTALKTAGLDKIAKKAVAQRLISEGVTRKGITKAILKQEIVGVTTEVMQELNTIMHEDWQSLTPDQFWKRLGQTAYGALLIEFGMGGGAVMVNNANAPDVDVYGLLDAIDENKQELGLPDRQEIVQEEEAVAEPEPVAEEIIQPEEIVEEPAQPTEEEIQYGGQEAVGVSQERTDVLRTEEGLEVFEREGGRATEEVRKKARQQGLVDNADEIAFRIMNSEEQGDLESQATPEEQYAMGEAITRLSDERIKLAEEINSTDGEISPQLIARRDALLNRIDNLTNALDRAGSRLSQAFKARQLLITRETYELANVLSVAEKLKGDKLTAQEEAEFGKLVNKRKDIVKEIDELEQSGATEEEIFDKKVELYKIEQDINNQHYKVKKLDASSVWDEYLAFPRAMMATADMSYLLRQGLIPSLGHPKLAGEAFGKSVKALFSQRFTDRFAVELNESPNKQYWDKYGLELSEFDDMSQREEMFTSHITGKIPLFGKVVRASERNMTTGLNALRTKLFDDFMQKHPSANDETLTAYAEYINAATGKGDISGLGKGAQKLSKLMFAPKFAWSRFTAPVKAGKLLLNPETSGEIARQWGALFGTGMTVLSLAVANGLEVGTDPEDPDFGKIKYKDSHIDVWGGLQQPMRLMARTAKAGYNGVRGEGERTDILKAITQFVSYKLNPAVTLPFELASGKDVIGKDITPAQSFITRTTPLTLQQMMESAYEFGYTPEEVMALTLMESLGVSVQNYKSKGKSKRKSRIAPRTNRDTRRNKR